MTKLYELTAAYNHIDSLIDNPELTNEQIVDFLNAIEGGIKVKAESTVKLIENLETTSEAIKAAEARLTGRRKAIENRVKSIKSYLLGNMVASGIHSIECEYFKIAVQENPPSVVIDDESKVPPEYLNTPEPPKPAPDKRRILEDVTKHGLVLEGIRIERGKRLVIK